MKVAFVFPPMWPAHSDGSLQIWHQEVTTRLCRHCEVMGYSATFGRPKHDCVDGVRYRRFSTRWDAWLVRCFRFIHRRLGFSGHIFRYDIWYPSYALKVALDLRRQRCDIVHVYYYPQYAVLIKRLNPGIRVVLHTMGEWLTQVKFTNLAARLRRTDLVVSCSDFVTRRFHAKFPDLAARCKTVPMGLDAEVFSRMNHGVSPARTRPRRLLYTGRISPEKGVHVLLDAFALILQRYPDSTLTIVGPEWRAPREDITDVCLDRAVIESLLPFYEGSYLKQLKQRLSPEVSSRVVFAGLVAHHDISQYYLDADIYINPSYYESFGMSIIEAMAAGLPVVVADGGAVADLVSDGQNGLLVETNNPAALAEAVFKIFDDPQWACAMAGTARATILKQFDWETICSGLMSAYHGLLDVAPLNRRTELVTQSLADN